MHFTLTEHTQDFLQYCRQKGHSPGTMAAYTQAIRRFLEYADKSGLTEVESVTRPFLRAYAQQVGETLSPGGAHARLRPIKTFFS